MAVSKFEFSLKMFDEKEVSLRTVKVELASVPDDPAKQQPVVTVIDRDIGFSMNMSLPQADYTNLQEMVERVQKYCDIQTIQKATLSIMAMFSPMR